MGDDDEGKICHQMLKTSLVCAPSWTSGIGATESDTTTEGEDDDDDDDEYLEPSSSQDSGSLGAAASSNGTTTNQSLATQTNQDSDLLTISVPTVYLTRKDPSTSSYHTYQLNIESSSGLSWCVYRRYSQFYALHQSLRKEDPGVGRLQFPPKRRINSKTSTIVQDRRVRLEAYMQSLCRHVEKCHPNSERDTNLFYKFLSYSSKLSETLHQHQEEATSSPPPPPT